MFCGRWYFNIVLSRETSYEILAVGRDTETYSVGLIKTYHGASGSRKVKLGRRNLINLEAVEPAGRCFLKSIRAAPSFEEVLSVASRAANQIRTIRRHGVADVGGYRNSLVEAREWCASAVGRRRLHDAERSAPEEQDSC